MAIRKGKKGASKSPAEDAAKTKAVPKKRISADERKKIAQQKILSAMEEGEKNRVDQVEDRPHEFVKMALAQIIPNPRNARTRHINPTDPLRVTLDESHPDYEELLSVIADIEMMGEHLKDTPLQTPISIYRDASKHMLNEGHVRYFGMLVAFGPQAKISCKLYFEPPPDTAARRFRENNARHDLPLKAKLIDLQHALEKEGVEGRSQEALAKSLGISRTNFRRMSLAVDTPVIWNAVDKGAIVNIRTMDLLSRKGITKDEALLDAAMAWLLSDEGNESALGEWITEAKQGKQKEPAKRNAGGRRRQRAKIETNDLTVLQRLVKGELWNDFDWQDEDFESLEAFQEKINTVFTELKKEKGNG